MKEKKAEQKAEYAIQAEKLTKVYGDKKVVDSLNLSVPGGCLLALLGVNGAGKTTTIKMLSGLIRPTSGTARLAGFDICRNTREVKARINISPQETAVAMQLSVRENLEFVCGIYGYDRASAVKKTEEMLEHLSLTEVASQKVRTLSGGWQRRLSIAMALITDPQILFLDEPTLGLDVLARRELWQVIRQVRKDKTIVLTTHYLEEAENLADQVAVMAQGRLIACGTGRELMELSGTSTLEDAFVALCERGDAQ